MWKWKGVLTGEMGSVRKFGRFCHGLISIARIHRGQGNWRPYTVHSLIQVWSRAASRERVPAGGVKMQIWH